MTEQDTQSDPRERRSLALRASQWRTLEQLAAEHGAITQDGPLPHRASWRTLVARIADSLFSLRRCEEQGSEPEGGLGGGPSADGEAQGTEGQQQETQTQ